MNKQIIITLEVDSDDEYCMMDAFIKDDLATEIGCCSNFYEIKDVCIGASAEPKTPSNGSITSMNTEKMHVRTTDDCISRQEAKDAIDMALDHIDHVPPWVYDKLLNALNEVPSAEPGKKGKWQYIGFMVVECSECNTQLHALECANFCPNCGAYMRGDKDEDR